MKTIGLAAILALTSTAAFAGGFQFSIDGRNVRIDLDESCSDRLCASVSWQERGSRERRQYRLPEISTKTIKKYIDDVPKPRWNSSPVEDDEDSADAAEPPAKPSKSGRPVPKRDEAASGNEAQTERDEPAPGRKAQAEREPQAAGSDEPAPPRARRAERTPPSPAVATSSPPRADEGDAQAGEKVGSTEAAETGEPDEAPAAKRGPASRPAPATSGERSSAIEGPRVAAVAPKAATEPAAKPSRPTPVGEWLVEDGEGKIRIEECGANMCGYVSAAKNPNEKDRHNPDSALRNRPVIGTPILINMKPDGKRWSGRIYNVKDGRSYTAHISLKNADTLRVEGCAFGGMICGGQNWSRVN